jgi:hypothetical protein
MFTILYKYLMRRAITDVQNQVEEELIAVETNILDFLRQAERIFSERNAPASEVKLAVAKACMRGLKDVRAIRNRLLAQRQLFEVVSVN